MPINSLQSLIPAANEYCVLRSDVVDRILSCGSGDGAMLYLYIVRHGIPDDENTLMRELNFNRERFDRAVFALENLKIFSSPTKSRSEKPNCAPRYTSSELHIRRADDKRFQSICQSAEAAIGHPLNEGYLRTLYSAYDHLGLPADVIIDMLSWIKQEKGSVSRRSIEETAYLWADMGIYTAADSNAFLSRLEREKPILDEMLRVLDIAGREPSANEYRYLETFIHQGFTPSAVGLGKKRMYERINKFSWNYLKGILDKWHDKGIHTVEEITALEPDTTPNKFNQQNNCVPVQEDNLEDWEKSWLEQYNNMINNMEGQ